VTLSQLDSVPNKDFLLRYRVAGETLKSAVMAHRDDSGAYFTLLLLPPKGIEHVERSPMELIFVLDCSGSMRGRPMEQAKRAAERGLRSLQLGDTFQIIRFSNRASKLGAAPLPATKENVERGLAYLAGLSGGGGTMMIEGIKAALEFRHEPKQFRYVVFLTDGYIGNEDQILAAIHQRIGGSRIFSFGVGSSSNRYLLDRMARVGKGCVAWLGPNDSGADVMDKFFRRVSHPAITDVSVDWGDMQAADVYPRRIPDLFVGRPVILTGRFKGRGHAIVRVKGRMAGVMRQRDIVVDLEDRADHPGLASVWARAKIADLAGQAVHAPKPELHEQIKLVALEYRLLSAYTAFVAVDTESRTVGEHGVTVAVPVPVPDGVRYETTVSE